MEAKLSIVVVLPLEGLAQFLVEQKCVVDGGSALWGLKAGIVPTPLVSILAEPSTGASQPPLKMGPRYRNGARVCSVRVLPAPLPTKKG